MAHQSARGVALAALRECRRGTRFADAILQPLLTSSSLTAPDRAFATELFYGTLRNLTLLDFWVGILRPGSVDDESRDLLRLGLYQVFRLRTPGHAAVFETVELAPRRHRAFINAVLRSALRRADELQAAADDAPLAIRASHPEFLIQRWAKTYGSDAAASLCDWDNQSAPVYARINTLRILPSDFLRQHPGSEPLASDATFVRVPVIPTDALERGDCYIQDPSTARAVQLLNPQPSETVLDACAAPGGKSGMIAAMMQNAGTLVACDRDPARVEKLAENLARLGATIARVSPKDWTAAAPTESLPANSFDRILLDTPCTNTGVLRRRVDARWRLRPNDFVRMPEEQLTIVRRLVPLLKPGGTFVYSTCSIEPEENEQVVARALQEFPFLRLDAQQSVLPFRDAFDGAFAAKLVHAG